jgi:UPF0148 protein
LINGAKGMGEKKPRNPDDTRTGKTPRNPDDTRAGKTPRNPDDIMAGCLLRGGKMLPKACRDCGSPLFELKGETLCVVCRELGKESGKGKEAGRGAAPPVVPAGPAAGGEGEAGSGASPGGGTPAPGGETDEERELRLAIAVLARRAREETDPDRCRALMEAARNGALALSFLQR